MRKDIDFPVSENVFLAAIQQWNDDFQENTWFVHLVNNTGETLEMVMIVSQAYGMINNEQRATGTFRHAFNEVKADTFTKIEMLENKVLQLNNKFTLSYFLNNKMYDKTFVFEADTIVEKEATDIPGSDFKGILLK